MCIVTEAYLHAVYIAMMLSTRACTSLSEELASLHQWLSADIASIETVTQYLNAFIWLLCQARQANVIDSLGHEK